MATSTVTVIAGSSAGSRPVGGPPGRPRLEVIRGGAGSGRAAVLAPTHPSVVRHRRVGLRPVPTPLGQPRRQQAERPVSPVAGPGGTTSQQPYGGGRQLPGRPVHASGGLRLTRRGRLAVRGALVLLAVAAALAAAVMISRPAAAGSQVHPVQARYHVVLPGETLWSIAGEADPKADRREVIAEIVDLNALPDSGVVAGQRIALPPAS